MNRPILAAAGLPDVAQQGRSAFEVSARHRTAAEVGVVARH